MHRKMKRAGQFRVFLDRNGEAKYTGQEMRTEKGGVVKDSTDTDYQGVSALLKKYGAQWKIFN